ncbi:MFS transporter [Pseudomonas entomophila]|uniref:MFS transporter n=1 Tax=Pseudomonas entomophila TaxID=312306 RepID=UPI003EC05EEA
MTQHHPSIEDISLTPFHTLLTFRSAGGSFVDGYILSIIGIALMPASNALGMNSFWEGLIAASALIGIFFGGFLGGVLTQRLGRKPVYFMGPVLFVIASVAQFWVDDAMTLFVLRLIVGVAVGIEYPVATAMLTEFMPKRSRGPRLAGLMIVWFAGAASAYALGEYVLRSGMEDAWRWILASSAPLGLALVLLRLGSPESPRWLLSKGRRAEAEHVIKTVYGPQYALEHLTEPPSSQALSAWSLLSSGYGKRMFFVCTFWTCSIIPLFGLYAFAPRVMDALNLEGDNASIASMGVTVLLVAGCILATNLINVLGRRSLLISSFLFSGLALLGLALFQSASATTTLFLFGIYSVAIGGAQVLALVYPNEIFPTEIRAHAVGMGTSMSRIGAALGTYLLPLSIQDYGIDAILYVAAAITFAGLAVSWALAPETRSLSLQQAAALT